MNAQNHSSLDEAIANSTRAISNAEELLDLNTFIGKQRLEYEPFSTTERSILFKLNNFSEENLERLLYINEDIYLIKFVRQFDTELIDIIFVWKNPPKIFAYDLKIKIYLKDAQNIFVELSNSHIILTCSENSEKLGTIDPSEMLPSNSFKSSSKEETKENGTKKFSFKEKQKSSSSLLETSEVIELKIEIGKVDYGRQEQIESMLQKYLVETINSKMQ